MNVTVSTRATKDFTPDSMDIVIRLVSEDKEKDIALKQITDLYEKVSAFMLRHEVKEILKTLEFGVSEVYDSVEETVLGNRRYKRVFTGYKGTHSLTLKLPLDIKLATAMVTVLSEDGKIFVNVNFALSDYSKAQTEVMEEAIDIAHKEAIAIAKHFGAETVECKNIDYTKNVNVQRSEYTMDDCFFGDCSDMEEISDNIAKNITPDDITITESIVTTWSF